MSGMRTQQELEPLVDPEVVDQDQMEVLALAIPSAQEALQTQIADIRELVDPDHGLEAPEVMLQSRPVMMEDRAAVIIPTLEPMDN